MRALVVSAHTPPDPERGEVGLHLRLRLFVEALATVFDSLSFLFFVPATYPDLNVAGDLAERTFWGVIGRTRFAALARRRQTFANHYLSGIASAASSPAFFPYSGPAIGAATRAALGERPDLVFVQELHAILPLLRAGTPAPILFDLNDLLHVVRWRDASARPLRAGRLAQALQIPALLAAETRATRAAARTTVCAETDRRTIARLGAGKRAAAIPNAVPLPSEPPPFQPAPTLLFLGNYAYPPNVRAAERLARDIWPRVRRLCPGASLLIAGAPTANLPTAAAPPDGVRYPGFAPDLIALYAGARVVCCPLDVGGGTRLKLIEAAAHARAMVSTRVGVEGLEFRDGQEILLRDDDEGFAHACADLLTDDARCAALGAAARARALAHYDPAAIRTRIAGLAREIMREAGASS